MHMSIFDTAEQSTIIDAPVQRLPEAPKVLDAVDRLNFDTCKHNEVDLFDL